MARQFQRRRFFRYRPIRNKNCLWWTCLLTDREEMSNSYRGHYIDASWNVSVNLAKRFQWRRFKKKWPIRNKNCLWRAMFGNGSKQNVHSLKRTLNRCFLLSFSSFGWWVSEEKIKMWKVNRQQTTEAKVMPKAHITFYLARWAKKNIKMWIPTCNV